MREGLKWRPHLLRGWGLSQGRHSSNEKNGIEHTIRGQYGLQLQQGREKIELSVRWLNAELCKCDLHRTINRDEFELVGGKRVGAS